MHPGHQHAIPVPRLPLSLSLISQMWHVLVKEPGNEGILQDIMAWLDERCTRGGAGCFRGSNAEEVN